MVKDEPQSRKDPMSFAIWHREFGPVMAKTTIHETSTSLSLPLYHLGPLAIRWFLAKILHLQSNFGDSFRDVYLDLLKPPAPFEYSLQGFRTYHTSPS